MFTMRRKQLKVLGPIVLLVAVNVMNFFAWTESAADRAFHDKDVLSHVAVTVGARVVLGSNQPVTVLHDKRLGGIVAVARTRAEARTTGSTSPNNDRHSAVSARAVLAFSAARHRAIQLQAIPYLTRWSMDMGAATGANDVWRECAPPLARGRSALFALCHESVIITGLGGAWDETEIGA